MTDVLYIHPARHAVDAGYQDLGFYFLIPVGVIGLANMLRHQGHHVRGINYPAELLRDRSFKLKPWLKEQQGVQLVMVDLHWFEHAFGTISVARACHEVLPDARVVLGGFTASVYASEILHSFPEVDFVIRGDAELPLARLAAELARPDPELSAIPNLSYREHNRVIENALTYCAGSAEIDALDFVDLEFLEHADWYGILQFEPTNLTRTLSGLRGHWLCIGRGCLFDCPFCGGGKESQRLLAGREQVTLRAVGRVVEDIARLAHKGIDQVAFNLDPAIFEEAYWRALFAGLRQRNVYIGIYNEHFQLPSLEFVRDFAETADISRSEIALTLLSGSERVRRSNGKYFSNRRLYPVLSALAQAGIPLYVYFSFNLPGEDERSFRETLRLAREIAQIYPPHLLKMINQAHTIDPCCPISREPGRFSVQVTLRSFKDYYVYCEKTLAFGPDEVPPWRERGFTWRARPNEALESMIQRWNEFCSRQSFLCFRVPQSW
ncbi:MAG: B12-binding domain-containing radical SAM protein [Anaerolineae bacterium]